MRKNSHFPDLTPYLAAPRERRAAMLREMLRRPDDAFDALMNFSGPYPDHIHVVDVFPDYLAPLLSALLRKHPRLLVDRDLSPLTSGQRWTLLAAAIESGRPVFANAILAGLRDRNALVKLLVVGAIPERPFLQQPEARPLLLKLRQMKSMTPHRGDIRRALAALRRA